MEKGLGFNPYFDASKDSGGGAEKNKVVEQNRRFEKLMGGPDSEVNKAIGKFKNAEFLLKRELTREEKMERLLKVGFEEQFANALDEAKIDIEKDEEKANELLDWCLKMKPVVEKKELNDAETLRKKQIDDDLDVAFGAIPPEFSHGGNSTKYNEYKNKNVFPAVERLKAQGIDTKDLLKIEVKDQASLSELNNKKKFLLNVINKMRSEDSLTDEEQELMDYVGIKSEDLILDKDRNKKGEKKSEDKINAEEKESRQTTKPEKTKIDESYVLSEIQRINSYNDPIFRGQALRDLAKKAHLSGMPHEMINRINELTIESRSRGSDEFSKLPQKEDIPGWTEWYRGKLKEYLDPSKELSLRERGNKPFMVEQDQIRGKMLVDATPMIPEELKAKVEEELRSVTELRAMFFKWEKNHSNLKALANEEAEDFPSNELMSRLLNNLNGVVGTENKELKEGEGSKNVAKAIMMYWRMAETPRKTKTFSGVSLLESRPGANDGLDAPVPSIFNTVLSDKEVGAIREKIAAKCGGEYYETLGLILSKFMGIAARGSDSALPGISDSDCMGKLIYTRLWNYWKDEAQRLDVDDRGDRWLPDEISNVFLEIDESTGEYKKVDVRVRDTATNTDRIEKQNVQIRVALDCVSLQTKGEEGKRAYYLVDIGEGKYKIVKKVKRPDDVDGDVDSGVTLRSLVEKGELYKIDWESNSLDLMSTIKRKNQKSLAVYNMMRESITAGTSLEPSIQALTSKADLLDSALDHYGLKTKQWVGYLYLESWLRRHSGDFLRAEYGNRADISKNLWNKDQMKLYIENAERSGLISKDAESKLKNRYRVGFFKI